MMQASDSSTIFVPFRCPNCKDSRSFETLNDLRSHLQVDHSELYADSTSKRLASRSRGTHGRRSPVLDLFRADAIQIEENLRSFKESELNNKRQREEQSSHKSPRAGSRTTMNDSNRFHVRQRGEEKTSFRKYGHPGRVKYKYFKRQDKNRGLSSSAEEFPAYYDNGFPDEDFIDDSNPQGPFNLMTTNTRANGRMRPRFVDRMHNAQRPFGTSWATSNENLSFRRRLQSHGEELDSHVQETVSALSQEVVVGRSTQHAALDSLRTSQQILSQVEQSARERITTQQEIIASLATKLSEKEEKLSDVLTEMNTLKKQHVEEIEVKNILNQKSTFEREMLLQEEITHKQKELESLSNRLDIARQAVMQYRGEIKEGKETGFKTNNDASNAMGNISKSTFEFKHKFPLGGNKSNNDDINLALGVDINDDGVVNSALSPSNPYFNQTTKEMTPREIELSRLRSKSKQLENNRQTLLMEMQTLLETAATDNEKLRMELTNQGKQLSKLNLELERSKHEQSELLGETNTLYFQADLSLTRLKQMLEDKDGQLSTVTGQLEKAKEMQDKLVKEREDYLKLAEEKESKYRSLVQENVQQLQTMKESLTSSHVEKKTLEGKVSELKDELHKKEQHDVQMEDRLRNMENQLTSHEDWQGKMLQQINDKEDRLQKAKLSMEKMNAFLSDAADKELETRSKLEQFIATLIDRSTQAETELQKMKSAYVTKVQALNEAKRKSNLNAPIDWEGFPEGKNVVKQQSPGELEFDSGNHIKNTMYGGPPMNHDPYSRGIQDEQRSLSRSPERRTHVGHQQRSPERRTHVGHQQISPERRTHVGHQQISPERRTHVGHQQISPERRTHVGHQPSPEHFIHDDYMYHYNVNEIKPRHETPFEIVEPNPHLRMKSNNEIDYKLYRKVSPENRRPLSKSYPEARHSHSNNAPSYQTREGRSPPRRRVKTRPLLIQGKEYPYPGSPNMGKSKIVTNNNKRQMSRSMDNLYEKGNFEKRVPRHSLSGFQLDKERPEVDPFVRRARLPNSRHRSNLEKTRYHTDTSLSPTAADRRYRLFRNTPEVNDMYRNVHNAIARGNGRQRRPSPGLRKTLSSEFIMDEDGIIWESFDYPELLSQKWSSQEFLDQDDDAIDEYLDSLYGKDTEQHSHEESEEDKKSPLRVKKVKQNKTARSKSHLSSPAPLGEKIVKVLNSIESSPLPSSARKDYSESMKNKAFRATTSDSLESSPVHRANEVQSRVNKTTTPRQAPAPRPRSKGRLTRSHGSVDDLSDHGGTRSGPRSRRRSGNQHTDGAAGESDISFTSYASFNLEGNNRKNLAKSNSVTWHDNVDGDGSYEELPQGNHGSPSVKHNHSINRSSELGEERRKPTLHVIKRGSSEEQVYSRGSSLDNLYQENEDRSIDDVLIKTNNLLQQNYALLPDSQSNENLGKGQINASSEFDVVDGSNNASWFSRVENEEMRNPPLNQKKLSFSDEQVQSPLSIGTQGSREGKPWLSQDTVSDDDYNSESEYLQSKIKQNSFGPSPKTRSAGGYDMVMKELIEKYPYRDHSEQADDGASELIEETVSQDTFESTQNYQHSEERQEESTDNGILSSDDEAAATYDQEDDGVSQKADRDNLGASTDTDLEKISRPGYMSKVSAGRRKRHQAMRRPYMRNRQGNSDMANWTSTDTNDFDETDQEERWSKRCRRVALFCVLNYVDTDTLLTVSQVCREWRKISHHPSLWKRVTLRNRSIGSNFLITMSEWCTQTESLSLTGLTGRPQRLMESEEEYHDSTRGSIESGLERFLFACQGSLQTLTIENCDNLLTEKCLWLISGNCRMLTNLCYRSAEHPATPQLLWALGGGCPGITTLKIHPVSGSPHSGIMNNRFLLLIGQFYRDLQEVGFGGTDFDIAGLIPMIQACQRLKVIHFDSCETLTDDMATAMCRAGIKDLQTITITGTGVHAKAIETLQKNCRHLRNIGVSVTAEDFGLDSSKRKERNTYKKSIQALTDLQKKAGFSNVLKLEAEEVP